MNTIDAIDLLKEKFPKAMIRHESFLDEETIEVHASYIKEILTFLKKGKVPGFEVLMDLTGVDYLEPEKETKVVYLLHNPTTYSRLRVCTYVLRNDALPSVVSLWEGADWYERELYDLFGVKFEGHPDLKRLLMPDDWKGHPLRKDYALTEEPVEFKHGVKPKVPSEVIPHTMK